MRYSRIAVLTLLLLALCGGAVYAALQSGAPAAVPLASCVPPGALLAIESPDFASLLATWTDSAERKRWLTGEDYAGFSRSRLFSRLGQAQEEFATTAGLSPDSHFLQAVAGRQSLLAWYDIGNLEFLYITRLPPGQAARTPLLQLRDRFQQRSAGGVPFFVRTEGSPARTVAFAVHGDDLLLATREDLLAGALELLQHPADATGRTLLNDGWYAGIVAAAGKTPGDLRMTLDLARIVRTPYFRSYWVQQNITETRQYSAALSDLYRTPEAFREERVLLPVSLDRQQPTADLSPVLNLLPPDLGIYHAEAAPTPAAVLAQLEDKLLSRSPSALPDSHTAPGADLSTPETGDAGTLEQTLEQRIDEPPLPAQPREEALAPLRTLLFSAAPTALLTFSTASDSGPQSTFIAIHTVVALASAAPWNAPALQNALTAALLPRLSVNGSGLRWTQQAQAGSTLYTLTGPQPLAFAVTGNICILASDGPTLLRFLAPHATAASPRVASSIAGFSHTAERGAFLRLTSTLDRPASAAASTSPAFFSGNIASLSQTFADLDSESFTQSPAPDHTVHQTVLYRWKH